MLFNSYLFVLLFLPICVGGYYFLNNISQYKLGMIWLLGMSLWFYGYYNLYYLQIMIISIVCNYMCYLLLRICRKQKIKGAICGIGVLCNVGTLFYFKYYDFFLQNINKIFNTEYALSNIMLPLGISFFTFQQISFLIDTYRNETGECDFLHYACFISFFPQLVAGPIVTYSELVPQFQDAERKKINWESISSGIFRFSHGMAKKVLIADTFGKIVDLGYSTVLYIDSTNAIITIVAYTFQIYFDFSGYCDMAIGIAKMLNISIPENFDSPYKADTVKEFWRRWHMTLTRFLTKYVYIPLGGNRKGEARSYINILIVFLVSGLWHGAGWGFVLWGIGHGLAQVFERIMKEKIFLIPSAVRKIILFVFINIMWIFFRANSAKEAVLLCQRLLNLKFGIVMPEIIKCFESYWGNILFENSPICDIYPILIMVAFFIVFRMKNLHEKCMEFQGSMLQMLESAVLLVWCVFSFSGVTTFLYFGF